MITLYKVLGPNGESIHGGDLVWSLPTDNGDGTWTPGDWHEVTPPIKVCRSGLHLTTEPWRYWITWNATVYEAEGGGNASTDGSDKSAYQRARLLRPVLPLPDWWARAQRFVREEIPAVPWFRPDGDPDPAWRLFVAPSWNAARAAARNAARNAARDAAHAAAYDAARAAARNAARNAARDAADDAAHDAARDAARDAAYDAADDAAYDAARAAARNAARDAAYDAAHAAAYDAAYDAADDAARDAAYAAAYAAADDAADDAARAAAHAAADDAADDAARDAAYAAAYAAAYDAALAVSVLRICADLPIDERHRQTAREQWRVWQKGYGLAAEVGGVLYVYAPSEDAA